MCFFNHCFICFSLLEKKQEKKELWERLRKERIEGTIKAKREGRLKEFKREQYKKEQAVIKQQREEKREKLEKRRQRRQEAKKAQKLLEQQQANTPGSRIARFVSKKGFRFGFQEPS